jgi:hypothetical protein
MLTTGAVMVSLLMQNTQKISQLLNEIGFDVFNIEGYNSMQCAVNCSQTFVKFCDYLNDVAKLSGLKLEQFVIISNGSKVALLWLTELDDDAGVFSEVTWSCNFMQSDWSAIRGRCAEFGTTVNGAMEISEAIENLFAWTDRDKI